MTTGQPDLPQRKLRVQMRRGFSVAVASLAAALATAPESAAYGALALAPLGAEFAPVAMALALLGLVVANVLLSVLGAGRLVTGPRASISLLTATLVFALTTVVPGRGAAAAAQILLVLAVALLLAGAIQVLFGGLKLGTIAKYTPHPVRVGMTSGVGLLLLLNALPVIAGHRFGTHWSRALDHVDGLAVMVGLVALGTTWIASRVRSAVPPVLVGLIVAALCHAAMVAAGANVSATALMGTPLLPALWPRQFLPAAGELAALFNESVLSLLVPYALTVAVLGSLDALLAVSVVDGRLRQRRDVNRELAAQGAANIAAALAGGQATSPSIPRSLALVVGHSGPRPRQVVLAYAAGMLLLLLLAPELLGRLPTSAVGGILLLQGVEMVSPALWRAPLEFWRRRAAPPSRGHANAGRRRLLRANWAVEMTVALSAVLFGLGPAVLIGASFAVLLFVRANMRDVVRREWTNDTRRSLKTRPPALAELLKREGRRIALLELEGALFFGTADGLRARLEALAPGVDSAILDLHQVVEIDVTAARILLETAENWQLGGKQLSFAEWTEADPRRRLMEAVAGPGAQGRLRFFDSADLALEHAEDQLLQRFARDDGADAELTLSATMFARGLSEDELALLSRELQWQRFERGQVLFNVGDRGDALYITLQGDIGLRIPGGTRRLASFAAGVTLGEMAVLSHGARSAQAVAETDVTALKLSIEAFDRIVSDHPALATKLMRNMSLHLADRVRVLTGDLAHWVSRAAAGHQAVSAADHLRSDGGDLSDERA